MEETIESDMVSANCVVCYPSGEIFCHLCSRYVADRDAHIVGVEHQLYVDRFSSTFTSTKDEVYCTKCDCKFSWDQLKVHGKKHKLIPWNRAKPVGKTFYLNYMISINLGYYCTLCAKAFDYWDTAAAHFEDPEHQNRREIAGPTTALPKKMYHLVMEHSCLSGANKTVKCILCGIVTLEVSSIREHCASKTHLRNAQFSHSKIYFSRLVEMTKRKNRPKDTQGPSSKSVEAEHEKDVNSHDKISKPQNRMMVPDLNWQLSPRDEIAEREISLGRSEDVSDQDRIPDNEKDSKCLEDIPAQLDQPTSHRLSGPNSLYKTIITAEKKQHEPLENEIPSKREMFINHTCKLKENYFCFLCQEKLFDGRSVLAHFTEIDHQNRREMFGPAVQVTGKKCYKKLTKHGFTPGLNETIECKICNATGMRADDIDRHIFTQMHVIKKLEFTANVSKIKNKQTSEDSNSDSESMDRPAASRTVSRTSALRKTKITTDIVKQRKIVDNRVREGAFSEGEKSPGRSEDVSDQEKISDNEKDSESSEDVPAQLNQPASHRLSDPSSLWKTIITAKEKQDILLGKKKPSQKGMFINHTCQSKEVYFCFLCREKLFDGRSALAHFTEIDHQNRREMFGPPVQVRGKGRYKKLTKNGFTPGLNETIECKVCNATGLRADDIDCHTVTKMHGRNKSKFMANVSKIKNKQTSEDSNSDSESMDRPAASRTVSRTSALGKTKITTDKVKQRKIVDDRVPDKRTVYMNRAGKFQKNYYCFLCEKALGGGSEALDHFEESGHIERREKAGPVADLGEEKRYHKVISQGYIASGGRKFDCKMCGNTGMTFNQLAQHASKQHHENRFIFVDIMVTPENGKSSENSESDDDLTDTEESNFRAVKIKPAIKVFNRDKISEPYTSSIGISDFSLQQSSHYKVPEHGKRPDKSDDISSQEKIPVCETMATINEKQHKTVETIELTLKTLFINHTCKFHNTYYCFLCSRALFDPRCASVHFEESRHQKRREMAGGADQLKSRKQYKKLVLEGYLPGQNGTIECKMCDKTGITSSTIKDHRISIQHQINLAEFRVKMEKLRNGEILGDENFLDDDSTDSEESNSNMVKAAQPAKKRYAPHKIPDSLRKKSSEFYFLQSSEEETTEERQIPEQPRDDPSQEIISAGEENEKSAQEALVDPDCPASNGQWNVITKNKPDFGAMFFNRICKFDTSYYCFLCEKTFDNWFIVSSHFQDSDHRRRVKMSVPIVDLRGTITSTSAKFLATQGFVPGPDTTIKCQICNYISDDIDVRDHIKSSEHQEKRAKFVASIPKREDNIKIGLFNFLDTEASPKKPIETDNDKRDCDTGNIVFAFNFCPEVNTDTATENHEKIPRESLCVKEEETDTPGNSKILRQGKLCGATTASNDTQSKKTITNPTFHPDEILFINHTIRLHPAYYCFLCAETFANKDAVSSHIDKSIHQTRRGITGLPIILPTSTLYTSIVNRGLIPGRGDSIHCKICQVTGLVLDKVDKHCKSALHEKKVTRFIEDVIQPDLLKKKLTLKGRSKADLEAATIDGYIQWESPYKGYCYLCNTKLMYESIHDGPVHRIRLERFNSAFINRDKEVYCKTCDRNIEWREFSYHAKIHKIFPWYNGLLKPDSTTIFNNHIYQYDKTYYCFLCKKYFDFWDKLIDHFKEIDHENRAKTDGDAIRLKNDHCKFLILQGFVPGKYGQIDCRVCGITGIETYNLQKHSKTPEHISNKEKFDAQIGWSEDTENYESKDSSSDSMSNEEPTLEIVKKVAEGQKNRIRIDRKTFFLNYTVRCPMEFYCTLCEKTLDSMETADSHFNEIYHQERREIENTKNKVGQFDDEKFKSFSWWVSQGLVPGRRGTLECKICCTNIIKLFHIKAHVDSPEHLSNKAIFNAKFKNSNGSSKTDKPLNEDKKAMFVNHTINFDDCNYCCLCGIILESWNTTISHFQEIDHEQRKAKIIHRFQLLHSTDYSLLVSNGFVPGINMTVECEMCDEDGFTLSNFANHVKLSFHKENKEKFHSKIRPRKFENQNSRSDCIVTGASTSKSTEAETSKKDNIPRNVPYSRNMICNFNIQDEIPGRKTSEEESNDVSQEQPMGVAEVSSESQSCLYIVKQNAKKSFCQICDERQLLVATKRISLHIAGPGHRLALKRYGCDNIVNNGNDTYYCRCCNCGLSNLESLYLHIKDKKHMSSLVKVCNRPKLQPSTRRIETPTSSEDFNGYSPNLLSSYIAKHINKPPIGSNSDGETSNAQSGTIPDTYQWPPQNRFRDFVAKQNTEISAQPDGTDIAVQPELSTLVSCMALELSRFNSSCDTRAMKEKASRQQPPRPVAEKTAVELIASNKNVPCLVCTERFEKKTELHAHMASHYIDDFIPVRGNADNVILPSYSDADEIPLTINVNQPELLPENFTANDDGEDSVSSRRSSSSDDSSHTDSSRTSDDDNEEVINVLETRKSKQQIRKMRRVKAAQLKNAVRHLDFDHDYIYNLEDKLEDLELGLTLGVVIDSSKIYCLICRKPVEYTLDNYSEHLHDLDHCNYLDNMEMDDALFQEFQNDFSDLDLAKEYMQEISEDTVRCIICADDIANDVVSLQMHISHELHELRCEVTRAIARKRFEEIKPRIHCDWYDINKYWCVVCGMNTQSEVEFAKHLRKPKHAKNIKKSENENKRMMFDYCPTCALLWYGYRCTHYYHSEIDTHVWLERDGFYVSRALPIRAKKLMTAPEEFIDEKIQYLEEIQEAELVKEKTLLSDLKKAVRMIFPRATAYPFGSRVSGLGAPDSDIDIFLDCLNMYNGKNSKKPTIQYFINAVNQCLSKDPQAWDVEELLPNCRSPIIKARHRATGLACDLSFGNGLAVENTKLIRTFNRVFPMCRKLTLFLKQWLLDCDLSGSDRITNYTLYWLVIFYLQKELILPSVATLIEMQRRSCVVAGWQVGVIHEFKYNEDLSNHTMKEFLRRFFTYYSEFDFRYDVASPLIGDVVKKRTFVNPKNLPRDMERYVSYIHNSRKSEPFRIDSAMCVQDPFDLQHNLTKAVNKVCLNRFRKCCALSLELILSS